MPVPVSSRVALLCSMLALLVPFGARAIASPPRTVNADKTMATEFQPQCTLVQASSSELSVSVRLFATERAQIAHPAATIMQSGVTLRPLHGSAGTAAAVSNPAAGFASKATFAFDASRLHPSAPLHVTIANVPVLEASGEGPGNVALGEFSCNFGAASQ